MSSHTVITIEGMSCNHCQMAVEKVLSQSNGIEFYKVDLAAGEAEITGNPDLDTVLAEINKIGYYAKLKA